MGTWVLYSIIIIIYVDDDIGGKWKHHNELLKRKARGLSQNDEVVRLLALTFTGVLPALCQLGGFVLIIKVTNTEFLRNLAHVLTLLTNFCAADKTALQ